MSCELNALQLVYNLQMNHSKQKDVRTAWKAFDKVAQLSNQTLKQIGSQGTVQTMAMSISHTCRSDVILAATAPQ